MKGLCDHILCDIRCNPINNPIKVVNGKVSRAINKCNFSIEDTYTNLTENHVTIIYYLNVGELYLIIYPEASVICLDYKCPQKMGESLIDTILREIESYIIDYKETTVVRGLAK